jgi:hypothetical protein
MKWTYSVRNKMAASGALFLICLLVLFSNYIDRDRVGKVSNLIDTMYEDRLLAENYILKMMGSVYQIKEVLKSTPVGNDAENKMRHSLSDINTLMNAYQKTKLTDKENTKLAELTRILNDLELSPLHNTQIKLETTSRAVVLLNELSTIQVDESKLIIDHAEILRTSGKMLTQFALAIMIVIILVLQALVLASKTLSTTSQTPSTYLN